MLSNRDGKEFESTSYDVAITGDYNIGGDAWSSRILLEKIGLRVVAQWSGDGSIPEFETTPKVKLNLLHCYRSMNYISRHIEEKYGIPWLEYNFFGPTKIVRRNIVNVKTPSNLFLEFRHVSPITITLCENIFWK